LKPISPDALVKAINDRLRRGVHPVQKKENVATILESETQSTIALWLERVDGEAKNGASPKGGDSVATILESEAKSITKEWLRRINDDEDLCAIELDDKTRSSLLAQLFKDLVHRLRHPPPLGTKGERSDSAH
jgi:hypothetical protein